MAQSKHSIIIDAPVDTCYRVWDDPQQIVYIIDFVKDVYYSDDETYWRWEVYEKNGEGKLIFDTIIVQKQSDGVDRHIAWVSVEDAPVSMMGAVHLYGESQMCSRVSLTLRVIPDKDEDIPVVDALMRDLDEIVRESLDHFKTVLAQRAWMSP